MQVDKTTLADLSIFHSEEEQSVFHHLNYNSYFKKVCKIYKFFKMKIYLFFYKIYNIFN